MSRRPEQQAYALVERWREEFGNVMEAMADVRPAMEVDPTPPQDSETLLWWHQNFDLAPGAAVWIGAAPETWTALAQKTLEAAGIESSQDDELHSTYLEVVRQSLGALANALGAEVGHDVTCTTGSEDAPSDDQGLNCRIAITLADKVLPHIAIHLSHEMLAAVQGPADADPHLPAPTRAADGEVVELSTRASGTLDLLMDVEMPVCVSFGRTQVRVQDIMKLITGSIIEMDRNISEPVEVIVNNCVIARGEVVVVDGNYGVRISEVMSRSDRLKESRRYLLPGVSRR